MQEDNRLVRIALNWPQMWIYRRRAMLTKHSFLIIIEDLYIK